MKKGIQLLIVILCLIVLFPLTGCGNGCSIGLRLYENDIFIYTVGYDTNRVSILGLTDKGREQEYLIVPEKIDGKDVVALSYNDYNEKKIEEKFGDKKYSGLRSDNLKKIFIIPKIQVKNMDVFQCAKNLYGVFYLSNESTVREGVNHYNYYYTKENEVPKFTRDGRIANVSYYYNYEQAPNNGYYWIDNYNYGEKIEYIPPIPERDGYAFDGWYKESDCINKWNFETDALPQAQVDDQGQEIYQETKLYAKWISVLDLGGDTNYVTIENDDNTLTFVRYNGEHSGSTFYIPETIGGKTVTEIAAHAFDGKTNITEIVLPKTIKKISAYAFAGLESLTTITFAGTGQPQLEKIGYGAFSGCTNLKKFNSSAAETLNRSDLIMPDSVEFIDCYAFYGTGFTEIFLGTNIYYIGDVAFSNIAGLTNISVTGNSTYFSSNGALYNSDGWLMQYPVGKDDTSFTIPSSVSNVAIRHISQFAFMGENNLDTINLGNVITIDSYAFAGCTKLSGFDNASNIEYVGPFALDDTRIMLGTQDFITLGKVLYKYKGTASVLEASDFPSGVTRIASNAFCCNDNIEKIYLPNKIIDIDNNAFVDCANLDEIIYYNDILPDVGKYSFHALPDTFKFKCRKRLIDSVTSSNNWYSQRDVLSAISTEVYFEDINKTATFYWGETVELPTETISGKYIKGWLRVDESTGQTCGDYLSSSSVWNETVSHATYRADTETLYSTDSRTRRIRF